MADKPSIKTLYTMRFNQNILLRIPTIKINKLKRFIKNSQIQISTLTQCTMRYNLNTLLRIPMIRITLNMIQTSKITLQSSKITEESSNITEVADSLIMEVEPLQ